VTGITALAQRILKAAACNPGNSVAVRGKAFCQRWVNGNNASSPAGKGEESTMTSKTQNAENAESRPLDDHELELVRGGFTLIELLVQEPNQISIIMGMPLPKTEKVR
jgi:hypothetical protein